jgi:hypothetical protein
MFFQDFKKSNDVILEKKSKLCFLLDWPVKLTRFNPSIRFNMRYESGLLTVITGTKNHIDKGLVKIY